MNPCIKRNSCIVNIKDKDYLYTNGRHTDFNCVHYKCHFSYTWEVFMQPKSAKVLKFSVWVRTTVLYEATSNFLNRVSCPPRGAINPPKSWIISPSFKALSNQARMLKFLVWIGTTVLYEGFSNFWNRVPCPARWVIIPPNSQILYLSCDFDKIWDTTSSYVYQ